MEFLLFILATIGFTNILVHGKILDVIGLRPFLKRNLKPSVFEVFECYECSGFWSGLIMGFLLISYNPLIFISCGFAGSVLSQGAIDILNLIRSKTDFVVGDTDEQSN